MVTGRPTDYKPEYCQMVIDHMAEGFSFEAFAGLIGVCKQTIYNWLEQHPDFVDAKKKGFEASRMFWEKIGINQAKTGEGSATAFIFNMKNRFKEDWNDRVINQHEGAAALSINIQPLEGCDPIKSL